MVRKYLLVVTLFVSSICIYPYDKLNLTTHNLLPYGSFTLGKVKPIADETFTGIAVDLVRDILDQMDTEYEIQVLPWERSQILVKIGESDGFFAASQKDSRDLFAVISEPIANQNWNWYMLKKSNYEYKSESFKEDATFAGFLGSNMLKWMEVNNYNIKGTPTTTELLLKMLLNERVDVILAHNLVMDALLIKYNATNKVKSFLNIEKPLSIYFSKEYIKNNQGFIEEFNNLVKKYKDKNP